MTNYLKCCLITLITVLATSSYAQVGINTKFPDASSALDIFSNTKGFLMPRLTTVERDLILLPANGLMIYNTTSNDGQLNIGTAEIPIWTGLKKDANPSHVIESVTQAGDVSTLSVADILIPGMTLSPSAGTYMVLFNAQTTNETHTETSTTTTTTFVSTDAAEAVHQIYLQLNAYPITDTNHGMVFGNNEILAPGVYFVTGAVSVAGKLTLDGGGNANSIFIIRGSAAVATNADSEVELINGATANNVFWVSEGALSTGATTKMKGTLFAHNSAISLGAGTTLVGRMFTNQGAASMAAPSHLTRPVGPSPIELGGLHSFVMYSGSGAISGCIGCTITGDVGTAVGAATIFEDLTGGNIYLEGTTEMPNPTTNTTTTVVASESFYSIYKDDIEVPNSSRKFNASNPNVTLQTMITILEGESISVKWKAEGGKININNRILSLIRSF